MAQENWYEKIAKSGWLGTKAQVSAENGNATWSSGQKENPMSLALKRAAASKAQGGTDQSGG